MNKRSSKPRPVIRINEDGTETWFESLAAGARSIYGGSGECISKAIERGGKAYGYKWRFEDNGR